MYAFPHPVLSPIIAEAILSAAWMLILLMIYKVATVVVPGFGWERRILDSVDLDEIALDLIASNPVNEFDEIVRDQVLEDAMNGLFVNAKQPMTIFVTSFDGRRHVIEAKSTDTVDCVKSNVAVVLNIPGHVRFSLRFGGKFLDVKKCLSDYDIVANSSLLLHIPIRGGCGGSGQNPSFASETK